MSTAKTKKTFRVVVRTSPAIGQGCYFGQDLDSDYVERMTTVETYGVFNTKAKAEKAAIEARDNDCKFECWAEDFYDGRGAPYFSGDGENFDEDEFTKIYVVAEKADKNANK